MMIMVASVLSFYLPVIAALVLIGGSYAAILAVAHQTFTLGHAELVIDSDSDGIWTHGPWIEVTRIHQALDDALSAGCSLVSG